DPTGALERAVLRLERLSREKGGVPHVRLTAAFSDGERLFAVRYASDEQAPTLYHRWSLRRGGRAVVSEPLEQDEGDWLPVAQGSFCLFEGDRVRVEPFRPDPLAVAA
ncbi:class II glutamine amidotransferase, partial [Rhodobacter sphaeroides]|uniref:class II glutamine amidotransferase n=1 Tax=Cereibacter sphaeroides TaxID=1063 RepID=UPI001414A7B6|nr:class II glutamine amidotransferase [Cereibacter sphaeroides]